MSPLGSPEQWAVGAACLVLSTIWYVYGSRKSRQESDANIPWAPNRAFLIGHALLYKKGPPEFLQKSQDAVGPLFRINLAGRRMIVVGSDPDLQRAVGRQPESALSSCQAIAQIGFDYTLGTHNVFIGTEFHKRLLKNTFYQDWDGFCKLVTKELRTAIKKELMVIDLFAPKDEYSLADKDHFHVPDVFKLARITILRTILAVFCGKCFVEDKNIFLLKELMELQDKIEDATAAAAVLPRSVANWLVLSPTRKFREKVQEKICKIIQSARLILPNLPKTPDKQETPYYGPWLVTMDQQKMDVSVMAELIVGLVFAAHKNPAIGAAQSYCHLWEHKRQKHIWDKVQSEAQQVSAEKEAPSFSRLEELTPTLEACVRETTRITAHSLGSLRYVCKPVELKDSHGRNFTVYPGETVSSSHYLYNVDPKLFPEQQNNYRPDLVLEQAKTPSNGEKASASHAPQLTTFSEGTHRCPGERVATILMKYFVALLLDRKASVIGSMPPVSFERATLAQRHAPVPIKLLRTTRKVGGKQPTK